MYVALLIIGLMLGLLLLIACLPIRIQVDTRQAMCLQLSVGWILGGWLEASENGWFFIIAFPGFRKRIDLLKLKPAGKRPEKPSGKKKRGRFPSPVRMMKAFRLRYLDWQVDTGDFVLNSQLYPLGYFLSRNQVQLNVNFTGVNYLRMRASSRVFRLLAAVIRR